MIQLIGITATIYLAAHTLNLNIRWLKRLQWPTSLYTGILLLLLGPQIFDWLPHQIFESYQSWPSILISFLFAGLILEPSTSIKIKGRIIFAQGLYVWLIAFLQLALGYAVVSIWATPNERLFANTIELSFLGGHGASSAFVEIATRLGFKPAADLAITAATIGLIVGMSVGLVIVEFHRRFPNYGKINHNRRNSNINYDQNLISNYDQNFDDDEDNYQAKTVSQPMSDQKQFTSFLLPILPVFISYLTMNIAAIFIPSVSELPLFFFVIVVAYLLKKPLADFLDRQTVRLFHSLVLEGLILSAIATLSLKTIHEYSLILFILCGTATILTVILHLYVAPKLIPYYYPDLAIINYGMSTGTTAVGVALLRTLRPRIPIVPLNIYGIAAPLSGPFIGGGILSLVVFPELSINFTPIWLTFVFLCLSFIVGFVLYRIRVSESSNTENS